MYHDCIRLAGSGPLEPWESQNGGANGSFFGFEILISSNQEMFVFPKIESNSIYSVLCTEYGVLLFMTPYSWKYKVQYINVFTTSEN